MPARLIGHGLTVDLYPEHLEIRYGQKIIEKVPRLANDHGAAVNYRHIIGYLIRKPGAFAQYQYRESLFPRVIFRQAYDALMSHSSYRGHKDYLQVLHLAAMNGEGEVAAALEILLEAGQNPVSDSIKSLLDLPVAGMPTVQVRAPNLNAYDALLKNFINPEGGHAIYH